MEKEDKIDYLNRCTREGTSFVYSGPALLYKYRSFDQYTYDMLENKYLYLCPADKLDDETECIATIDDNSLVDLNTNSLKRVGLEQVIRMIKPYTSEENYEEIRNIIYRTSMRNGRVRNSFLLDAMPDLQELVPDINLAPFFNVIVNLPDQLEKPEIRKAFIDAILNIIQKENIGICSLSEKGNIEDLWNRYGGNHTGYCVEYDMRGYSISEPLVPVIYEYERQTNVILALVNHFISQMVAIFSDGKIKVDISQYLRLYTSKYMKWKEQLEWRVIGVAKGKPNAPKVSRIIIGSSVIEENKAAMIEFCKNKGIECVIEPESPIPNV